MGGCEGYRYRYLIMYHTLHTYWSKDDVRYLHPADKPVERLVHCRATTFSTYTDWQQAPAGMPGVAQQHPPTTSTGSTVRTESTVLRVQYYEYRTVLYHPHRTDACTHPPTNPPTHTTTHPLQPSPWSHVPCIRSAEVCSVWQDVVGSKGISYLH